VVAEPSALLDGNQGQPRQLVLIEGEIDSAHEL